MGFGGLAECTVACVHIYPSDIKKLIYYIVKLSIDKRMID